MNRPAGGVLLRPPRRAGGDRRALRVGQVHAAARHRDAGATEQRRGPDRRDRRGAAGRPRAVATAPGDRLRLSAVLPGRARHGARERRRRDALRRRPRRRAVRARRRGARTGRPVHRATFKPTKLSEASGSGWRSPGRSSGGRRSCSPTSRPATSTATTGGRSWSSSASSTPPAPRSAITHDAGLADQLPRQIRLLDGQVVSTCSATAAPLRRPCTWRRRDRRHERDAGRLRLNDALRVTSVGLRARPLRAALSARDRDRNSSDRGGPRAVVLLTSRAARRDRPARHEHADPRGRPERHRQPSQLPSKPRRGSRTWTTSNCWHTPRWCKSVYRSRMIPVTNTGALQVRATSLNLLSVLNTGLARGAWLNPGPPASRSRARLGRRATAGHRPDLPRPTDLAGGQWFNLAGVLTPSPLEPDIDNSALIG